MITLLVGAYPPELQGLAGVQGALTRAIGIGLVEAAAGALVVLQELQPARVVLVGTAGAYPRAELKLGSVVVGRAAQLVVRPSEYAPTAMPQRASGDASLADEIALSIEAPVVDVASPLGITQTDAEARRIENAAVEQLEAFALFRAAERLSIPAAAVLAVSNQVGPDARAEWRKHRAEAEAAAQEAVRKWLSIS
jgi:nucleoside phosphorylase